MQYLSANPIQLCKLLPGIANRIALMAITKICPAYYNPVRRKIHLWKRSDMVSLCEHITHFATSFDARYKHRSRSSGSHSMIKSSKWWPTAFHWNGPPPDKIKPGGTQISNGLPNVKRRRSQNIDLVREKNTKTTWSGLKKRWSRKPE